VLTVVVELAGLTLVELVLETGVVLAICVGVNGLEIGSECSDVLCCVIVETINKKRNEYFENTSVTGKRDLVVT
jgi:hypothetical protein